MYVTNERSTIIKNKWISSWYRIKTQYAYFVTCHLLYNLCFHKQMNHQSMLVIKKTSGVPNPFEPSPLILCFANIPTYNSRSLDYIYWTKRIAHPCSWTNPLCRNIPFHIALGKLGLGYRKFDCRVRRIGILRFLDILFRRNEARRCKAGVELMETNVC